MKNPETGYTFIPGSFARHVGNSLGPLVVLQLGKPQTPTPGEQREEKDS